MNRLEKLIKGRGIAFSHKFTYTIRQNEITMTVGEVLFRMKKAAQNKPILEVTDRQNDNLKMEESMIQQSSKELSLMYLQGEGLKFAVEDLLGRKEADYYQDIIQTIATNDLPLLITTELVEDQQSHTILYRVFRNQKDRSLITVDVLSKNSSSQSDTKTIYEFIEWIYNINVTDMDIDEQFVLAQAETMNN